MQLDEVTHETFEALQDEVFRIAAEPAPLELRVESVRTHAHSQPDRTAFSVFFRGPAQPLLPQRIYRLEHAEQGALEVFIVPVGRDATGTEYEAAFT